MKTQSLDALHRLASARLDDYRRKLTKSRQEEWQRLSAQHPIFWHWIHHAFRVTEEQWSQDAEEWIRIYKEVSLAFGRPELLQKEHLNRLREDIMIRIEWACQGLEHQIQMAANAQSYTGELPGGSQYDVLIRGRVLNVIITSLEVLEAEGEAARADEDNRAAPPQLCEQHDEVPGSQATSTQTSVQEATARMAVAGKDDASELSQVVLETAAPEDPPAESDSEKGTIPEAGIPEQHQRTAAIQEPVVEIATNVADTETVVQAPAQPVSSNEIAAGDRPTKKPRHYGFPPDMPRHRTIAGIVERHVPNWRISKRGLSHSVLKIICADLDATPIDVPDSWRAGKPEALDQTPVETWVQALELAKTGKKLVADQIRTSLAAVLKSELPK